MNTISEGAILESVVFLDHFTELPDPRQLSKVVYPLDEILLLSLLAVVAGAETFTAIAEFGRLKLGLLRRFRPFAPSSPSMPWAASVRSPRRSSTSEPTTCSP